MQKRNSGAMLESPQPSKVLACSATRRYRPVPLGKMSSRLSLRAIQSNHAPFATYLGHVDVAATQRYLTMTPEVHHE
jgi:hypothetical protein